LVDPERDRSWYLAGKEAAIWDWLALDYDYGQVVRFLSLLLDVSEDEAGRMLCDTLHSWQDMDIVMQKEVQGGQSGDQRGL
jgi:hypothetical protein